ncbi:hypothetical protein JFU47_00875 [Pseudomonas sp. TH39(2020)]|uniref:hypothetical protein n=1 Tax=Pseudomonas sp. TH39(2020) TaxID=2796349 RepID=UPI0019134387|nr:hypothetical protein [Pseudomonas sp. TH39(2020)]MBK5395303.1 hypothetical protein [Pseudomonas sp. TH39(2020)]
MLVLTDMQRAYHRKLRALSTDLQGNEIFAGLTIEESMRFNFLSESLLGQEHRTQEDVNEYLTLHEKHEHDRLQVLGAETEARQHGSARH